MFFLVLLLLRFHLILVFDLHQELRYLFIFYKNVQKNYYQPKYYYMTMKIVTEYQIQYRNHYICIYYNQHSRSTLQFQKSQYLMQRFSGPCIKIVRNIWIYYVSKSKKNTILSRPNSIKSCFYISTFLSFSGSKLWSVVNGGVTLSSDIPWDFHE